MIEVRQASPWRTERRQLIEVRHGFAAAHRALGRGAISGPPTESSDFSQLLGLLDPDPEADTVGPDLTEGGDFDLVLPVRGGDDLLAEETAIPVTLTDP